MALGLKLYTIEVILHKQNERSEVSSRIEGILERIHQIRERARSQEQVEYDWEMEMTDSLKRQSQGVHFEYV